MDGGRAVTRAKRERQAAMVRDLVTHRFGPSPGEHPFIVLGDLNDYPGPDTGVGALTQWGEVVDAVGRRVPDDRWTHYWREGEEYQQLDYLLLSRRLAAAGGAVPEIVRHGLPRRARRYTGPRLDGVGENAPSASDHCPVVVEVSL
jgi:endonuclease/exonuclease/phosphatase family metal-dependent hydrolase